MKGQIDCPCCGKPAGSGIKNFIQSLERYMQENYDQKYEANINSCSRCEKHNKSVGGSPTSEHLRALAFDLRCLTAKERYFVLKWAFSLPFKRILLYKTFIHLGISKEHPQEVVSLM